MSASAVLFLFGMQALAADKAFPIASFVVPGVPEIQEERSQERWACLRAAGLKPPGSTNCPNCAVPPDGQTPVDGGSVELRKWLQEHLLEVSLVKGCKLPTVLVSSGEQRVDRESCSAHAQHILENTVDDNSTVFIRATSCLEKLNPALFHLTDPARRELRAPKYSCFSQDDPENLKYWEGQCRARLKDPKSQQAKARVTECMNYFTNSSRITIQHPVFPDRWIMRYSVDGQQFLAAPDVSARVQFRELFARSGLGADSPLADGCLGACGPLPGSAYVATLEGCRKCATYGQDGVSAMQAAQSCSRMALNSHYAAISEFQSLEECERALDRGARGALARACTRLQKASAFQVYCKGPKLQPAACFKDREARGRVEWALKQAYQNALKTLLKQDDWNQRQIH